MNSIHCRPEADDLFFGKPFLHVQSPSVEGAPSRCATQDLGGVDAAAGVRISLRTRAGPRTLGDGAGSFVCAHIRDIACAVRGRPQACTRSWCLAKGQLVWFSKYAISFEFARYCRNIMRRHAYCENIVAHIFMGMLETDTT